jgi:hypothetical protein
VLQAVVVAVVLGQVHLLAVVVAQVVLGLGHHKQ